MRRSYSTARVSGITAAFLTDASETCLILGTNSTCMQRTFLDSLFWLGLLVQLQFIKLVDINVSNVFRLRIFLFFMNGCQRLLLLLQELLSSRLSLALGFLLKPLLCFKFSLCFCFGQSLFFSNTLPLSF